MENLINKDEEENSDDSRSSPTEFIKNESVDMEEDDSDMSDGIVVEERGDGEDADRSDDRLVESFLDSSYEEPKVKLESDLLVENIEFPSLPNPVQIKKKEKSKKELEEEEREKMQVLVSNFTEDQLNHYEMFRRSAFPRAAIKRLMQILTGTTISQNVVIAMAGIAKVFVGEIVEEALDVMERKGDSGPIQPKHIREGVRRLRRRSYIPNTRPKPPISL